MTQSWLGRRTITYIPPVNMVLLSHLMGCPGEGGGRPVLPRYCLHFWRSVNVSFSSHMSQARNVFCLKCSGSNQGNWLLPCSKLAVKRPLGSPAASLHNMRSIDTSISAKNSFSQDVMKDKWLRKSHINRWRLLVAASGDGKVYSIKRGKEKGQYDW